MAQTALSKKTVADFAIWKTVKLGVYKNADEYRKALKKAGMKIGPWADDILGKPAFTVSETKTEVDLVVLFIADLGFKEGAKYSDICARAKNLGLELCPAKVGPYLRLAYKDQPRGEWLIIAMNAITDSYGGINVFNVEHHFGGLSLHCSNGRPDIFWHRDHRFVFVRPR